MHFREYIVVMSTKPIARTYIAPLQSIGLEFSEIIDDFRIRRIVTHNQYDPTEYLNVRNGVAALGLDAEVIHGVLPIFSMQDRAAAELLEVSFGDIEVEDKDFPPFSGVCATCGCPTRQIQFDIHPRSVRSNLNFGYYDGALLASFRARHILKASSLTGFDFIPFDEKQQYFHIVPKTSLGRGVLHPEEFYEPRDRCSTCGRPQYKLWFGPRRFRRADWNGDDCVLEEFLDRGILFTPRAFAVLRSFQYTKVRSLVFLE